MINQLIKHHYWLSLKQSWLSEKMIFPLYLLISVLLSGILIFWKIFELPLFSLFVLEYCFSNQRPLITSLFRSKRYALYKTSNLAQLKFFIFLKLYYNPFYLLGMIISCSILISSIITANFTTSFILITFLLNELTEILIINKWELTYVNVALSYFVFGICLLNGLFPSLIILLIQLSVFLGAISECHYHQISSSRSKFDFNVSFCRSNFGIIIQRVIFAGKEWKPFILAIAIGSTILSVVVSNQTSLINPITSFEVFCTIMIFFIYEMIIYKYEKDNVILKTRSEFLQSGKATIARRFLLSEYTIYSTFFIMCFSVIQIFIPNNAYLYCILTLIYLNLCYFIFQELEIKNRKNVPIIFRSYIGTLPFVLIVILKLYQVI